jgi:hypothetical protein
MAGITYLDCCGLAELTGVQGYRNTMFNALITEARGTSKGALIFTGATVSKSPRTLGAQRFAKDIEAAGLGTVTAMPVFKNPNTENYLHTFLWAIDWTALINYCKKNSLWPKRDIYGGW